MMRNGYNLSYPFFRIGNNCDLIGKSGMRFEKDVTLHRDSWLIVPPCVKKYGCERYYISIGNATSIGRNSIISATNRIEIGRNVLIGPRVTLIDNNHIYSDVSRPIKEQGWTDDGYIIINDNCWIGVGAVIIGASGITIGHNVIIGANTVVLNDVPPFSVVVGIPARVVKRFDDKTSSWISV